MALAVVALGAALLIAKPNPFADDTTVYVDVRDAASVGVVGNDVRMNGAIVGHIATADRSGEHARLRLEITPAAARALRTDARAAVRPRTVLEGNAYVELHAGSASAPPLGDTPIPLARTTTYVPADHALRFATPAVRAALQHDLDGLARAFADRGAASTNRLIRRLPVMLRRFEVVGAAAGGRQGDELASAIDGARRTFAAAASAERDLSPLLRGIGRTSAAFAVDGGRPLQASLRELPGLLARLRTGGTALTGIVDELEPLGEDLAPAMRELLPVLVEAQPVLATTRRALMSARPLVSDLRGALRAGARAAPPARRLIDATTAPLRILDQGLLPALSRRVDTGAPAYQALVNAASGGAGAFRSLQTPATPPGPGHLGDGHFVRFFVRFYSGVGLPKPSCSLLELAHARLATEFERTKTCAR